MTVILEWNEPESVSGNANRPIILVDSGYAVDRGSIVHRINHEAQINHVVQ
jgi:hypothetical protein